jgi:hypothetical protein
MRLYREPGDKLKFVINREEREVVVFLLGRYPVLDPSYHQLSQPAHREALAAEQALLTEHLTEDQQSNRRRIAEFIQNRLPDPDPQAPPLPVIVTLAEADWLLRIVNDIRVGCWVRLGRPESDELHLPSAAGHSAGDYAAMELSGLIQMVLLEAIRPS